MKQPPAGWPRMSSSVFYQDASAAIDWLVRAFGFEVRLMVGTEMVGDRPEHAQMASPRSCGGKNTQCLGIHVDDVDAHCARARAAGADIFREPATVDYGAEYWTDRNYGARDPEGHIWFFMQRLRDPGPNA
jgi:uncharacterized glyoxalase superfamily protein PhnB